MSGPLNMRLEDIIDHPEQAKEIPLEAVPPLLAQMAAAQCALAARLCAKPAEDANLALAENGDRLITVDDAAEKLKLTKQYVYGLLKSGDIPSAKFGKYVRIRASDLNAWIEKHIENPIDSNIYRSYSKSYERNRTSKNSKNAWAHSRVDGRKNRREIKHSGAMGTGRVTDIRTRREVDSTDRKDRDEPKAEA
jgi:excisionase family DNA binding protein